MFFLHKIKKFKNTLNFFHDNPFGTWSLSKGRYVKHIEAMDRWLKKYSSNKGVFINNKDRREYPEVTGYWIETLLKWGYVDNAKNWFNWLISIQNKDGGWPDYNLGPTSVLFDSGQIIRGIKHYADYYKIDVSPTVKKFLSYFSKVKENYLIPTSSSLQNISWHLINLQAAWIVYKYWPEYISISWLKSHLNDAMKIWKVGYQASHFDVYILEAMYELGIFPNQFERNLRYFDKKVNEIGFASCTRDNNIPCYTATAQLGVLYYKMGRKKDGDKLLFNMLKRLNTHRGNWPGSEKGGSYFPNTEVSWGLKYFLDLLYFHITTSFDLNEKSDWFKIKDSFQKEILEEIKNTVRKKAKILEIGCGLGRYLQELKNDYDVFGSDISKHNVNLCKQKGLKVIQSSLTEINLPTKFPKKFDLIYAVEAFEHAVFPSNALGLMKRKLTDTGKIMIIDKDPYQCFYYRLCPFERYYSKRGLNRLARQNELKITSFLKIKNFLACEMVKDNN